MKLVLDWDGTVTERDTLHAAIERFGDLDVFHGMESELGRRLTLEEVIAVEIATIQAPLADVVAYLTETVVVRPGFHELVERHQPLVVSAGFHELIEPILDREGVSLAVIANRVEDGPDGLRAVFRQAAVCEICGERCKRSAVTGLSPFAYVGDGAASDGCVALAADLVFARAGLAVWLGERGVRHHMFDDLHDVAARIEA